MSRIHVLLIGSGGREHALAASLSKSQRLGRLFCAPGNPGTALLGTNVRLAIDDPSEVISFCRDNEVGLVVVGPEKPLVDGLADALHDASIPVFGPMKEAARLEGSKEFAKRFMERFDIPTAACRVFDLGQRDALLAYLRGVGAYPVVLKADGLAAGKGVVVCVSEQEAMKAYDRFESDATLRAAAGRIIVEEFMAGEEASVFVLTDGHASRILHVAQDHKRIGDGDTGPNTGGMGAYCPAPVVDDALLRIIDRDIVQRTITGMQIHGCPYTGVLYVGLMLTEQGPKVVEYNCRFGDPECQCILPSIQNDLLDLCMATTDETLDRHVIQRKEGSVCCVVLASEGYPESYPKGRPISGIEKAASLQGVSVFHAGTTLSDEGLVTSGGRVLNVVGEGEDLPTAIRRAYEGVAMIHFDGMSYRTDIGAKGLSRL